MPLRAGDLRHRIQIWRNAGGDDGRGGIGVADWRKIAEVWAEVVGQNGREAVIAHALQGISVYRIRIRYGADITQGDQIRALLKAGPVDLNVKAINDPFGDNEQLVILADTESVEAMPDGA